MLAYADFRVSSHVGIILNTDVKYILNCTPNFIHNFLSVKRTKHMCQSSLLLNNKRCCLAIIFINITYKCRQVN